MLLITFFTFILQQVGITVLTKDVPVSGAKIYSISNQLLAHTNSKGHAELSLQPNDFPIQIVKEGYTTVEIDRDQVQEAITVYMIRDVFKHDEVVVTGVKDKLSEGESFTPIQVKTLIQAPKSTGNMKLRFAELPEVMVQESSANGGSPIYKGFRANKLLFTVNGIRFNNALFKSGNAPYVSLLNPVYFNQTSISDGANSILFGSDAIGGAINFNHVFQSKNGFSVDVASGYSSGSELKYSGFKSDVTLEKQNHSFGVYYGQGGDVRSGTSGNKELESYYRYSDGDFIRYQRPQPAGFKHVSADYDGSIKLGNVTLGWGVHYSKQYDADDFFRLTQKQSKFYKYDPLSWNMEYLSFETMFSKNTTFVTKIYHQFFQEVKKEVNNKDKSRTYSDAIHVYGVNLSAYTTISDRLKLSYGLDLVDEKSKTSSEGSTPKYPNDATQNQFGMFGTFAYELSKQSATTFGIRYSYQHSEIPFLEKIDSSLDQIKPYDEHFQSFTLSVGYAYETDRYNTSVTLNNAFRAPNFDDLGKSGENKKGKLHLPNTGLSPEKSINISWKNSYSFNTVLISSDLYSSFLSDLIEETHFYVNGANTIRLSTGDTVSLRTNSNLDDAVIYGASLGLQYASQNLQFENRISYVFGEQVSGEPLSKIPPFRMISSVNYRLSQALSASVLHTYSAKQNRLSQKDIESDDRISPNGTPSYSKFDLGVTYTFSSYMVYLELENVFDELYRNHASALNGLGRSVNIELSASF